MPLQDANPTPSFGGFGLSVREYVDRWEIEIDFGDVRPRDEAWTTNGLFIGSINSGVVSLRGEFRGDNLPEPIKCDLAARPRII